MHSPAELQEAFVATLNHGPARLEPALFAGPADRVLLGLKAHANTISHARLVALEDSFPLTREHLGSARFNRLSRGYVETAAGRSANANAIGQAFADYLRNANVKAGAVQLAEIEWAWLESYHAPEAEPIDLAALAALEQPALLGLPVAVHPSVRLVITATALPAALDEFAGIQPFAIAALRPFAEVRLLPLGALQHRLLAAAHSQDVTIGNLLALTFEQAGEQAPWEPLFHLVGAGALIKQG